MGEHPKVSPSGPRPLSFKDHLDADLPSAEGFSEPAARSAFFLPALTWEDEAKAFSQPPPPPSPPKKDNHNNPRNKSSPACTRNGHEQSTRKCKADEPVAGSASRQGVGHGWGGFREGFRV